jgi:hypothetical protein
MSIWLYYWYDRHNGKNLGDFLSLLLTRELSQNRVLDVHVFWIKVLHRLFVSTKHMKKMETILGRFLSRRVFSIRGKILFAMGSIMEYGHSDCIYWGSGFMKASSVFCGGIVKAVRGKLSKDKLRDLPYWDTIAVGDPALLLPIWKKYNTIQYNTIQYNTIQYNTIQYNTIQYTFHYTTLVGNRLFQKKIWKGKSHYRYEDR